MREYALLYDHVYVSTVDELTATCLQTTESQINHIIHWVDQTRFPSIPSEETFADETKEAATCLVIHLETELRH